jgi:hypothetical protein
MAKKTALKAKQEESTSSTSALQSLFLLEVDDENELDNDDSDEDDGAEGDGGLDSSNDDNSDDDGKLKHPKKRTTVSSTSKTKAAKASKYDVPTPDEQVHKCSRTVNKHTKRYIKWNNGKHNFIVEVV